MGDPILKIQTDQSGIIEQLNQENELLKEILSIAAAEKMQQLDKENKILISERDNLQGQVSQTEKRIKEVKEQAQQLIAEANKKHEHGSATQKGMFQSQIYDLEQQIYNLQQSQKVKDNKIIELNAQIREQELRITESKSLLIGRDEEIERLQALDEKVTSVLEIVTSSFELLKEKFNSCSNIEDMKKAVDQAEKEVVSQLKTGNIKEEYIEIMRLKSQGLTQKAIAEKLYPNEAGREQKVIKRIKRGQKENWTY